MCWVSATRSVRRPRARGLGSSSQPSTCRAALGGPRASLHPPSLGRRRQDSQDPGREPQEDRQGQGWTGQPVGAQGLRRSAGSLQKALGWRGPSTGHPALPRGCGHWVLGAHAVSVCECACTGVMQSRVSPVGCLPPQPYPPHAPPHVLERYAPCRGTWQGAQEPRGLRDPTPGRVPSLPLARLLTGLRGRWFFFLVSILLQRKIQGRGRGRSN